MSGCIFCPDEAEELVWIEYRVEATSDVGVMMVDENGEVLVLSHCSVWPEGWVYAWPEAVPCGRRIYLDAYPHASFPGSSVTVAVYRNGGLYLTATASGSSCHAIVEGTS